MIHLRNNHALLLRSLAAWLTLSAASVLGQAQPELGLTLRVDSFRLLHVAQDRAEAEIDLSVTADIDAQIERIDFYNVHLNGVPFFASAIDTPLELHRRESLHLPPVTVTVYTGDLDSTMPLIRILEDQKAQLVAEIELRLHATLLEHLVLGNGHPVAVVDIDQPVSVQAPEGLLGRSSSIAVLRLAQVALDHGGGGLLRRIGPDDSLLKPQVETSRQALLHARTCYTVAQKKSPEETCVDRLAFAMGEGRAFSSADLGQPWRFDPALARSFLARGSRLSGIPRVSVQTMGERGDAAEFHPAVTFTQAGQPVSVQKILYPGHSQSAMLQAGTPGSYGRLQLPAGVANGAFRPAPAIDRAGQRDSMAVFLLVHQADGTWTSKPVYLSGTVAGETITFSRPVDRSAIGSPILTPDGVIGVVQSETAGTLMLAEDTGRAPSR